MATSENKARFMRGEIFYAFTSEMVKARRRCGRAVARYNDAREVTRRQQVQLWRDIVDDKRTLPPPADTEEADEALFENEPWVEAPIRIDYGTNLELGDNVFINFNCTIIDTAKVRIGARAVLAPNVSLLAGKHPLDPAVRDGTKGPEMGSPIEIEDDCWIGANVIILPGIRIGEGSTVGAGSVVTKNVPPYSVVAGNPARLLRQVPRNTDEARTSGALAALERDAANGLV